MNIKSSKPQNKKKIPYDDGDFIWSDDIQYNTVRYGEEQDADDL